MSFAFPRSHPDTRPGFQSIPSKQVTLPSIAIGAVVTLRRWVLTLPERLFTEAGYEALVKAYEDRAGGCEWPDGDPGEVGFRFCGLRKSGHRRYCGLHAARSTYRGRQ